MTTETHCQHCNTRILQKGQDGRIRVRTKMLIFDEDGSGKVVCKKCGRDVPLAISLKESLVKALGVPKLRIKVAERT